MGCWWDIAGQPVITWGRFLLATALALLAMLVITTQVVAWAFDQHQALGEAVVCASCAAVGLLHRAEQLLFELVSGRLVEVVVGEREPTDRHAQMARRIGDRLEQFLPGFG